MSIITEKKILVSGSSQGIGFAIASLFAKNNKVWIMGRYADKLEKSVLKHNFAGFFAVDFFDENSILNFCNGLNENFDVLINNAGVYFYNPIEKMKDVDILNSFRLNSLTPYFLSKSVIPYMKKQSWGRIINIGSISGVMGEANASAYSMTKASLIGLTKSLALETAQHNITVNVINPGWVDTELIDNDNLFQDFSKDEIIETIPQRRFVSPEEIASVCEFLISDKAKTITGQSINICAGLSLGF